MATHSKPNLGIWWFLLNFKPLFLAIENLQNNFNFWILNFALWQNFANLKKKTARVQQDNYFILFQNLHHMDERKLDRIEHTWMKGNWSMQIFKLMTIIEQIWTMWMKIGALGWNWAISPSRIWMNSMKKMKMMNWIKLSKTTCIKPSKSTGFMKLTIYMKLNTQMKHKMKMSLMDEIKFMMSMQSNSLCTKVYHMDEVWWNWLFSIKLKGMKFLSHGMKWMTFNNTTVWMKLNDMGGINSWFRQSWMHGWTKTFKWPWWHKWNLPQSTTEIGSWGCTSSNGWNWLNKR